MLFGVARTCSRAFSLAVDHARGSRAEGWGLAYCVECLNQQKANLSARISYFQCAFNGTCVLLLLPSLFGSQRGYSTSNRNPVALIGCKLNPSQLIRGRRCQQGAGGEVTYTAGAGTLFNEGPLCLTAPFKVQFTQDDAGPIVLSSRKCVTCVH